MGTWRETFMIMVLLPLFVVTHPTGAQKTEASDPFYKGKTIRFIASGSAGSGLDVAVRAIARHLGRFVPGEPNVIVQNMPGAGGLIAANYSYNVAKPDGLTIGAIPAGNILLNFIGDPAVQFESKKFQWIGTMSSADRATCFARRDLGFKTISDVIGSPKPLVLGSTGPGGQLSIHPRALNAVLGTNFKMVEGYNSAPDVYLAVERGEVGGMCGLFWSSVVSTRRDWVAQGFIDIFLQMGFTKHPELPQVPLVMDLVTNPEDRVFLEALYAPMQMARPYFAPPAVPGERVKILREAFINTVKDPTFLKEAERTRLEISPSSGEEVQSLVEKVFATPPAIVRRIAELLKY